jgi:endonuclease-8
MPEGDTVCKLAAALAPALRGTEVIALRVARRAAPPLVGRRILDVTSKGKHLFIHFDNALVLRTHLGLYGSWHLYAPGEIWKKPQWQATIVLEAGGRVFACFNAREVEVLRADGQRLTDGLNRLGPDLARETPTGSVLAARARALLPAETALVDLLLDQRVASGIGNVYKCEVLFLAGQSPLRRLGDTPEDVLARLYGLAAELLRRNLQGGPRVTRFIEDGRGRLWVYGRAGRFCLRCAATVRRAMLGANPRSTYWCPACQCEGAVPPDRSGTVR